MSTVLVINHGTTTSTDCKPDNLLSEMAHDMCIYSANRKIYSRKDRSNGVLCYPGFGTDEFGNLHNARRKSVLTPKHIAKLSNITESAYARPFMKYAASWLWEDLEYVTDGKRSEIKDILFIGWSRGAILTWYQIYDLAVNNGFMRKFRVLAIDPSYGPAYTKDDVTFAQGVTHKKWEILMLFQFGGPGLLNLVKYVLTPYPTNNPHERFFLPGVHSSPVENDQHYGSGIKDIAKGIVGKFLSSSPGNFSQNFNQPTFPQRRKAYAQCKKVDKSWNFSHCDRPYVKGEYNSYRANEPWANSGFFYNRDDYETFNAWDYSSVASAFCKRKFDINMLKREYKRMISEERIVAQSVWRWANHNHLNRMHWIEKNAKSFIKNNKP